MHRVELHGDFLDNFGDIPQWVRDEMALVIEQLVKDAFHIPDRSLYIVEPPQEIIEKRKKEINEYGCQGLNGWEGWALCWYFEYDSEITTVPYPDTVVVIAIQAPAERLRARRCTDK